MSSQSQNEPRRDLVPNVDSELSQASLPGTLRPREQLSFREQIEQGAGRAIVALESLPVIVEFFGAARGEGAGVGPHGISFSTLDERLRGSVLPTEIEGEGAALFNSRENVISFLRAHAARIEAAPVEEQVKIFDEAQAKIIAALDRAKYDIYCLLDKTRCGPREESDDGEIKSYLLMAKVLGQLYEDGMPRPHLPHLEKIMKRGQESLQRTSEAENPSTRVPVDTSALAPLPEPMRDACNRMFNAVGRFVSPEMVVEHGLGRNAANGNPPMPRHRNSHGSALKNNAALAVKYRIPGLTAFEIRAEFCVLACLLNQPGSNPIFKERFELNAIGDLLTKPYLEYPASSGMDMIARYRRKNSTDSLRNLPNRGSLHSQNGTETLDPEGIVGRGMLLKQAANDLLRGGSRDVRASPWYQALLEYIEKQFGYSLLRGRIEAEVPNQLKNCTANVAESLILGAWLMSRGKSLTEAESGLLCRLSGANPDDIEALCRFFKDCQSTMPLLGDHMQGDTFMNISSNPYHLYRVMQPLFDSRDYVPLSASYSALFSRCQATGCSVTDPKALVVLASQSSKKRESVIALAHRLMRETGLASFEFTSALLQGHKEEELQSALSARTKTVNGEAWALYFDELLKVYEAAKQIMSKTGPYAEPNRSQLRGIVETLIHESDHERCGPLIHASVLLYHFVSFSAWRKGYAGHDFLNYELLRPAFHFTRSSVYRSIANLLLSDSSVIQEAVWRILETEDMALVIDFAREAPTDILPRALRDAWSIDAQRLFKASVQRLDVVSYLVSVVRHVCSSSGAVWSEISENRVRRMLQNCFAEALKEVRGVCALPINGTVNSQVIRREFQPAVADELEFVSRLSDLYPDSPYSEQLGVARLIAQLPWGLRNGQMARLILTLLRHQGDTPGQPVLSSQELADSRILELLTGRHLINRIEDVEIALNSLKQIFKKGRPAIVLRCVRELLDSGFLADVIGFQFRNGLLKGSAMGLLGRELMRGSSIHARRFQSLLRENRGELSPLEQEGCARFLRSSPYGVGLIRSLKYRWEWIGEGDKSDFEALGFSSKEEFDHTRLQGPGIKNELAVIARFIDVVGANTGGSIFRFFRSTQLNMDYCPSGAIEFESNTDVFDRVEVFQRTGKLFANQKELMRYIAEATQRFIDNSHSFPVTNLLERDLVMLSCRALRPDGGSSKRGIFPSWAPDDEDMKQLVVRREPSGPRSEKDGEEARERGAERRGEAVQAFFQYDVTENPGALQPPPSFKVGSLFLGSSFEDLRTGELPHVDIAELRARKLVEDDTSKSNPQPSSSQASPALMERGLFEHFSSRVGCAVEIPGISGAFNSVKLDTPLRRDAKETVEERLRREMKYLREALTEQPIGLALSAAKKLGVSASETLSDPTSLWQMSDDERRVVVADVVSRCFERLGSNDAHPVSKKDLRSLFYAHILGDERLVGSVDYMIEKEDPESVLCGFVELVTSGRGSLGWQELLGKCSPNIKRRFATVPDVEPLYGPLRERISLKGKDDEKMKIALQLHTRFPASFVGEICDSCAHEPVSNYPNMAFVTFAEHKKSNFAKYSGGFILILTSAVDGNRSLIIRGYNPTQTLLKKVEIHALFDSVLEYVSGIASELSCSYILAPRDAIPGLAFSNRPLAHLAFSERFSGAPIVRVAQDDTRYNNLVIHDKCVLLREIRSS